MTALESLRSVQFVTVHGRRLAVLDADAWEGVIEWLESLEDVALAKEAGAALKAAASDRQQAGWLSWDDVREELE